MSNKENLSNKQGGTANIGSEHTGIKKLWYDRSPVLRFILLFILFMGIFYILLWGQDFFQEGVVVAVTRFDAKLASIGLNLFGYGTTTEGAALTSPQMTVNVKTGCDGIEAMAMFVSGVLAYTASWGHKIRGLLYGLAFLFAVNVLRVMHLWLTGLYMPQYFEFFHQNLWQIIFILVAILTWAFWISRIRPAQKANVSI